MLIPNLINYYLRCKTNILVLQDKKKVYTISLCVPRNSFLVFIALNLICLAQYG